MQHTPCNTRHAFVCCSVASALVLQARDRSDARAHCCAAAYVVEPRARSLVLRESMRALAWSQWDAYCCTTVATNGSIEPTIIGAHAVSDARACGLSPAGCTGTGWPTGRDSVTVAQHCIGTK